jgi:hypothetical protein
MEHSLALTQFLLTTSLGMNGLWLGGHLVRWCRRRVGRLGISSLALLGLTVLVFYFYVFSNLGPASHVLVFAVSGLNNTVLLKCFYEWVRILPRPWGEGGVRDAE